MRTRLVDLAPEQLGRLVTRRTALSLVAGSVPRLPRQDHGSHLFSHVNKEMT